MKFIPNSRTRNIGFAAMALVAATWTAQAQHAQDFRHEGQPPRGEAAPQQGEVPPRHEATPHRQPERVSQERPVAVVDRLNHGTIRHVDTHVVEQRPEIRRETEFRQNVVRHHDVEVDVDHARFWHNFVFGRRTRELREGCLRLQVRGGVFFYDSGIYYQPVGDSYQEVYPPVGAVIPALPDGAIAIEAGNLVYYYVGGAFYVLQDGGFGIAPPPIGVIVPTLPPGAIAVSINGNLAYQFNGVYYQPVFVNGVTQYQTFIP